MRIRITTDRAIELFNKGDNFSGWRKKKPTTEEELGETMGHGRCGGTINIADLNDEERLKLAGSDFLSTEPPRPGWPADPCLISMVKESYPHIFWVGSCASSEKDEV
jgi:hypothetical protein